MNSTISLVCPVKNMEGKLENLREWVLDCSENIEIILIADSCTDKTYEELKQLKEELSGKNIEVKKGNFGSPGAARNYGKSLASSPWIGFWDSDDLGFPGVLEEAIKTLNSDEIDAIFFGFETENNLGVRKKWKNWPENIHSKISRIAVRPGIWRMLYKSDAIKNVEFPNLRMGEDQVFISCAGIEINKIIFSNKVAYRYHLGKPFQLTSNSAYRADIRKSINMIKSNMKVGKTNFLTTSILIKLSITNCLHGHFLSRIQTAMQLLHICCMHPKSAIRVFFGIWQEKVS